MPGDSKEKQADFSIDDQIKILKQFFENAAAEFQTLSNQNVKVLQDLSRTIGNQLDSMLPEASISQKKRAILSAFNRQLAELEQDKSGRAVIDYFKQKGLFRILYHYPALKGVFQKISLSSESNDAEWPPDEMLIGSLKEGFFGVGVSAVCVGFFLAASLLAAPAWLMLIANGLFAGAVAYLAALVYGVINDWFATHANLPYFLLGHRTLQTTVLKSNLPAVQAIGWGVLATQDPALLAAVIFTMAIMTTAVFAPIATWTLPLMILAMPVIAGIVDVIARKVSKIIQVDYGKIRKNNYQRDALALMSGTDAEQQAWLLNGIRNGLGYVGLPLMGIGALTAMITLSVQGVLPALVASSLFAVFLPGGIAVMAVLGLTVAGIYMYMNRDKQVDDRYKLDFSDDYQPERGFYFEEDDDVKMGKTLLQQYNDAHPANPTFFAASVHSDDDQSSNDEQTQGFNFSQTG